MMTKPIVAKFGLGRGENGPHHVRGTIGARELYAQNRFYPGWPH